MANKEIKVLRDKHKSPKAIYPKLSKDIMKKLNTPYITTNVVVEDEKVLGTQLKNVDTDVTYNLPLGTQVEANPTLEGTETELEGIKIDGTKYKVGGGSQLYQHNITVSYNQTFKWQFSTTIRNNSNTKFTLSTLFSYLNDNFYSNNDTIGLSASGSYFASNLFYVISHIYVRSNQSTKIAFAIQSTSGNNTYSSFDYTDNDIVFEDTVIAL